MPIIVPPTNERLALSIREAVALTSLSRTRLYRLLGSGQIKAVKLGKSTRILRADLEAWLASLPAFPTKEKKMGAAP